MSSDKYETLEQEVWGNITPLLKKRTTIIITHKKSIIGYADNIININTMAN